MLIVTNPDHNYAAEPAEAHMIYCLHQLINEHLEDLETCTWAGMQPGQFLTKLCIQELKIVLSPYNIYNAVIQRVDIVVEDLTTSNTAESPIQSDEGLLNQVTAPHCWGTQARQPIKHAVEADTDAEASQQCCKQARKV